MRKFECHCRQHTNKIIELEILYIERNDKADYVNACTRLVVEGEGSCWHTKEELAGHSVCRHVSVEC